MPYPLDDYVIQAIAEQRVRDYVREAEIDHMIAGLRPQKTNVVSRAARHTRHVLAHALTALGNRLDYRDSPDTRSIREVDTIGAVTPNH